MTERPDAKADPGAGHMPPEQAARVTCAPLEDMAGFDALVLSPGIPHHLPRVHPVAALAIAASVPILSDAELLYCAVRAAGSKARFAGITGTNGKSTTTTLLAHILEQVGVPVAAGGNLGPAALALPLLPDNGVYVLEMSSYMLERLDTLHFDAACLLNLTPDHLDRHAGMAGYALAKQRVFAGQTAHDIAVIGIDDAECTRIAGHLAQSATPCITVSGTNLPPAITARMARSGTTTRHWPHSPPLCRVRIMPRMQPPHWPWPVFWVLRIPWQHRPLPPSPVCHTGRSWLKPATTLPS